jgi:hypothetical protein
MSLGIQTRTALTDEELASRYQATDDPKYFAQILRVTACSFSARARDFSDATAVFEATGNRVQTRKSEWIVLRRHLDGISLSRPFYEMRVAKRSSR